MYVLLVFNRIAIPYGEMHKIYIYILIYACFAVFVFGLLQLSDKIHYRGASQAEDSDFPNSEINDMLLKLYYIRYTI